ncbi:MAG TPA: type II secretion system F family protein [Gemmatimonadaceae bacterium]|jgi:tight adherence protein C|nr:type II secretion system F family protein [Gemmatimonadaceae bacterium]
MPILLWLLIGVIVVSLAAAFYAIQLARQRRELVLRLEERRTVIAPITILRGTGDGWVVRVGQWLRDNAPRSWRHAGSAASLLVQAGFDGDFAQLFYTSVRAASAVLLPLAVFAFGPQRSLGLLVSLVVVAGVIGVVGPRAALDHLVARRRERIRRSIPDSLDLLVVCVEAGIGLDSALLRVARDMSALHPDLSAEFRLVHRTINAGLSREEAMHGLWLRTGVEELRGLASSMVQSERLGTSIARILRIYSETIRRKRRQSAEKRAAEASIKMIIPLALFMLPALFALVLGPAAMSLAATLTGVTNR